MKKLLIGTCIFVTTCLSAQDSKFSWGLKISPTYSEPLIKAVNPDVEFLAEKESDLRTGKISYNAYIYSGYNFNENAQVSIGIGWMNLGDVNKFDDFNPLDGNDPILNMKSITYTENLYYIFIPLNFTYSFHKKWRVEGGLSPMFLVYNTRIRSTVYNDGNRQSIPYGNDSSDDHFDNFVLSAQLGIGFKCIEKEKWSFLIQPNVNYVFDSVYKGANLSWTYITPGISLGIEI